LKKLNVDPADVQSYRPIRSQCSRSCHFAAAFRIVLRLSRMFCRSSCHTSLRGCAAISFQLNTTKTEVLWCAMSRQQHQIPREAKCVGNDIVQTAGWVRDLGIYLDSEVSMKIHVSRTVSSCLYFDSSGLFGVLSRFWSCSR